MCNVSIESVTGLRADGSAAVAAITVLGTADECGAVAVTIWLDGQQGPGVDAAYFGAASGAGPRWWLARVPVEPGTARCGTSRIRVRAECKDKAGCGIDFPEQPAPPVAAVDIEVPCERCPTVLTATATPTDRCDETGRLRVEFAATMVVHDTSVFVSWEPGPSGQSIAGEEPAPVVFAGGTTSTEQIANAVFTYPGVEDATYTARLLITPIGGACDPREISFFVAHQCGPCVGVVRLAVARGDGSGDVWTQQSDGRWPPTPKCLPAGDYIVRVVEPPSSWPRVSFSWSRDSNTDGSVTGRSFPVSLAAGDTVDVTVLANRAGCQTPVPATVMLHACIPCPGTIQLAVKPVGADNAMAWWSEEEVTANQCLLPGDYRVRVSAPNPVPNGATFTWTVNNSDRPEAGSEIVVTLPESGAPVEIIVRLDECPSDALTLAARRCPGPVSIEIRDSAGNVVDTTQPVEGGDYKAVAVQTDPVVPNATLRWRVSSDADIDVTSMWFDGGAEFPVAVTAPPSCAGPPATTVELEVTSCDCKVQAASVTMRVPAREQVCLLCELLKILALLLAGVAAIGLAIFVCSEVLANPIIDAVLLEFGGNAAAAVAAWHTFIELYAPWIGLVVFFIAAVLALVLYGIWSWRCKLSGCHVSVIVWQTCAILGLTFFYFGACPGCVKVGGATLWIGVIFLVLAVWLWTRWVEECRPTACRISFEMGILGITQTIVSVLDGFLQTCAWGFGWFFLVVVFAILDIWGILGMAGACRINFGGRGQGLGGK